MLEGFLALPVWLIVLIRKFDTVVEEAGKAAKEFFSQKWMNSSMSAR
jgi:hypothetical protein